ncbi:MAG TPA: GNAT family N-acetyltransferase [Hyphomicrobiaceae bacterium]|nr:GNAT family N-acetyltransferase [Hyphomicrobiaceae bacterium]
MALTRRGGPVELDAGYSVEIDAVDEAGWRRILAAFRDASIYQTWPYEEVRAGRSNISHLVLRKDGEAVAAAQARLMTLPLIGAGIAYVRWGPLWRRGAHEADTEAFRQAVRALRNEYACRRGLVVRLRPRLFREVHSHFASILSAEGYARDLGVMERTLRLDLTKSTEELRKGMRPHWRRYLKVAEKNDLEVVEGSADALFEAFIGIYRELVRRKSFAEPNDIREFRAIQQRLPADQKMMILLCKAQGRLCAGLICSAIGDTALYLFGATSDAGLKSRGSYLLHWRLIERLKSAGIATYDLHGINPQTNPGTYKFKADLCGSNGEDVHFLGQFDSCTSALSRGCVTLGDRLRGAMRTLAGKAARGRIDGPADARDPRLATGNKEYPKRLGTNTGGRGPFGSVLSGSSRSCF